MVSFWQIIVGLALGLIVFSVFFRIFHTYHGIIRFSSFVDLYRIACATFCSSLSVWILHQIQEYLNLTQYIVFPRFEDAVLIFIFATCIMWAFRVVVKASYDNFSVSKASENVFIYGCMAGGISLAKSIRNSPDSQYHVIGFVSTDQSLDGTWLLGVPVYYDADSVVDRMREQEVKVILVSPMQSKHFTNRSSLVDLLILSGIKIMMVPPAEEWDGKSPVSHLQFHEVDIEDLLPRPKIEVDFEAIGNALKNKSILVTGAAGSIGSELSRQIAKCNPSVLVLVDQAETPLHDVRLFMAINHPHLKCFTVVSSITDEEYMEKLFSEFKPEYVFHAAAYKHVPMMEDNPAQAVQNNIYGTRVIADLAVKYGTKKFVMVSTDKAVNPTNVMGCSKRICEIYCQSLGEYQSNTQFITTRFGNVLGSNGSVIPIFREQIKNGGPVKVTHPDIIRYFMLIPEACNLVLEAGTMGHGGEIFVFDMGKPVKIVDLAKRMIALSGVKNVKIEFTGLRDGEKLYEEFLASKEKTKPTIHPKIMVAQVREYPYELALKNEVELYELSKGFDDMSIVRKMKEIVPEYISHNSKYQTLDRV